MKKPTLCVIFGGKSSEYEVSLRSAYGVITHIDSEKYDLVRLGITRLGQWYIFEGENGEILRDRWQRGRVTPVTLDLSSGSLIIFDKDVYAVEVDLFLPILHGELCEDGRIQGLLDVAGVKYVGCGAFASHLCMDKILAKERAQELGIRVAEQVVVNAKFEMQNAKLGEVARLGFPVFVKPAMCGSSVGVSRVEGALGLQGAIDEALKYGERALIEKEIDGIEVEIGVLEEESGLLLSDIGTVKHKGVFYDYHTKYDEENEYLIPAPLCPSAATLIRSYARSLFFALGCRGLARFDFFVTATGDVVFNEVNTMPGFTEKSMFPMMFKGVGLDYGDVVETMIKNVL